MLYVKVFGEGTIINPILQTRKLRQGFFRYSVPELGFKSRQTGPSRELTLTPQCLSSQVAKLCRGVNVASRVPLGSALLSLNWGDWASGEG